MTAVISESYVSRPFTISLQAERELVFDMAGSDDEAEIQTLLQATAPAAYLGLAIESIQAEPLGNGVWKGYARYRRLENNNEYTFETGGGTTKITQSLHTDIYSGAYGTAPDFSGAIGVSGDSVEGTDITTPIFEFSETHYLADSFVLAGYKTILFNLTGKINQASFKGLAAGECLFLGASGSKRGDEQWQVTYRFAGSPNAVLNIGGISGIAKRGWDYLWLRYAEFADSSAFAVVQRPVGAYVEVVYFEGDFSTLGIGV